MSKKNQIEIVFEIVKHNPSLRTEQICMKAYPAGLSPSSTTRHLRTLAGCKDDTGHLRDPYIKGYRKEGDRTKTWVSTGKPYLIAKKENQKFSTENTGQLCMVSVAVCFCLASVLLFGTPANAGRILHIHTGRAMTKLFEGYRSEVYICPGGKRTIGYGFNLEEPQVKELISSPILSGKTALEKQEAEHVFDVLYGEAIKNTIKFLGVDVFYRLSNDQRYIIIDMAYNLGSRRLQEFKKMRAAIVAGDYRQAAAEMKDSKWYRQTGRRAKHHVKKFAG